MVADAEGQETLTVSISYTPNLPKLHLPNADAEINAVEQELGQPQPRLRS